MTSPNFAVLRSHHMGSAYSAPQVLEAIGHPELVNDPVWGNTCAIRMSVALIAAGVRIRPGRLKIKAGRFKDEMIEPGQRRLSDFLVKALGKPEKYKSGRAAYHAIAWRKGIISFFQIHGPTDRQGHIDLVSVQDWPQVMCSGSCYWDAVEVWFWPLK